MHVNPAPMRWMAAAALVGCLVTTGAVPARAATTYGCTCDASQGFNYQSTRTSPVGYLNSLTIGGTSLPADIVVHNAGTGASASVVGVIETDAWAGGTANPISLTVYISSNNRQRVLAIPAQTMSSNPSVVFDFANYSWDASVQKYYEAFGPVSPPLRGQLQSSSFHMSSTPGPLQTPTNYAMSMTLTPASGGAQNIRVAASSTTPLVKTWGS